MKKSLFIAVCALFVGATAFAQSEEKKKPTEEETINFLKEKFEAYCENACQDKVNKFKISACQITKTTPCTGDHTFTPSTFGKFMVEPDYIYAVGTDEKSNIYFYLKKDTPPAVIEKIEKAIKHLATFCIEDLF